MSLLSSKEHCLSTVSGTIALVVDKNLCKYFVWVYLIKIQHQVIWCTKSINLRTCQIISFVKFFWKKGVVTLMYIQMSAFVISFFSLDKLAVFAIQLE